MSKSAVNAVSPRTYVPQDRLHVWAMLKPQAPTLVGEVSLSRLVADCATFSYAPGWWNFALSEDLPLIQGQVFSAGERSTAPGAIDDARPDHWGERIIRHVGRPARLSILEMLLFAGDDRFAHWVFQLRQSNIFRADPGPIRSWRIWRNWQRRPSIGGRRTSAHWASARTTCNSWPQA